MMRYLMVMLALAAAPAAAAAQGVTVQGSGAAAAGSPAAREALVMDRFLSGKEPIDSLNAVTSHVIHAELLPGRRVDVVDTLSISVGAPYGFAAHLNNGVIIHDVRLDGRPVLHDFRPGKGAGVLWVDAPVRPHSTLVLAYSVAEERRGDGRGTGTGGEGRAGSAPSAGAPRAAADSAPPEYGQYFNTSGWHAYLDINGTTDRARYDVTVRAPAAYRITTSLPQTDSVIGRVRVVHGVSAHPQFLISLLYDRHWQPRTTRVGDLRVETFFRRDARIAHDTAVAAFARVYRTLRARFGPPNDPPYLAVVESFGYGARSGCGQRQADLVMCGGGVNDSTTHPSLANPSYTWAHETSHAWTMNANGPAATMLREGWATFAEGVALGAEHPELEAAFWERARNGVMLGTEGRQSLIPPGPTGGYYSKGAWVFHMFNYLLGDSAFDRAIRAYSQLQFDARPAGYPELIAAMSREAGYDLTTFAMPWFTSRFMPDLDAQVSGSRVIITQRQPDALYDLPKLEVELVTATGVVRRTIHLAGAVDTLDASGLGAVRAVRFDPDHHFLMQRHWGEIVRFALPASRVPAGYTVSLTGQASFALAPIPATREGNDWVVVLPLSEGRYPWRWEITDPTAPPPAPDSRARPRSDDRDPVLSGVREVKPLQPIGPYPR